MTDYPIDAHVSGPGRVTYVYADGHTLTLFGNHPYRDNNPGNLDLTNLNRARSFGAVGVDPTGKHQFGVFPSADAGETAFKATIKAKAQAGATIATLMSHYAPAAENNTTAYVAAIAKAVGSKPAEKLSKLSSAQIDILMETIRVHEGWRSHTRQTAPPQETSAPAAGR